MKEEAHQETPIHLAGVCSFRLSVLVLFALLGAVIPSMSQTCNWNSVFYNGERVNYEIYFKWGLIMPKAGFATFNVRNTAYQSRPAWEYDLKFHSSGVVEKFYKLRDTLVAYYSHAPSYHILFSSKRSDEGNFYMLDEMTFNYNGGDNVSIRSFRSARSTVRIDTVLQAKGCVLDMLSAVMHIRSIDYSSLRSNAVYPFGIAVGKEIINIHLRYVGQEVVKHSDGYKYNTHHFYVDVYDPAFSQSKEAAEAWVSNDDNHIPIRVRAKLKVGAAEVHYKEDGGNLQYPLRSRIVNDN